MTIQQKEPVYIVTTSTINYGHGIVKTTNWEEEGGDKIRSYSMLADGVFKRGSSAFFIRADAEKKFQSLARSIMHNHEKQIDKLEAQIAERKQAIADLLQVVKENAND